MAISVHVQLLPSFRQVRKIDVWYWHPLYNLSDSAKNQICIYYKNTLFIFKKTLLAYNVAVAVMNIRFFNHQHYHCIPAKVDTSIKDAL